MNAFAVVSAAQPDLYFRIGTFTAPEAARAELEATRPARLQ